MHPSWSWQSFYSLITMYFLSLISHFSLRFSISGNLQSPNMAFVPLSDVSLNLWNIWLGCHFYHGTFQNTQIKCDLSFLLISLGFLEIPFIWSLFILSINVYWVSTVSGSIFVIGAGIKQSLLFWSLHSCGRPVVDDSMLGDQFSWFASCYSRAVSSCWKFYISRHQCLHWKTGNKSQLPELTRHMSSHCFLAGAVLVTSCLLPLGMEPGCGHNDRPGSCIVAASGLIGAGMDFSEI